MNVLWLIIGAMLFAGALFVCLPIYWQRQQMSAPLGIAAVVVVCFSALLYLQLGSPNAQSGPGELPSIPEMVASLEQRLERNPDDTAGWKLLGRSQVQLGDFDAAIAAYEQAVTREDSRDAQTLADLAEAVMLKQRGAIAGRPAELFEAALAAEPNNPKALLYGGIAAIERGDRERAADRWEALLALSPPAEIEEILRTRIAQWRADPDTAAAGPVTVNIDIAVSDPAADVLADDTSVFVIARDPSRAGPPIAVSRRLAGELPTRVTLTDADLMIPGRTLAQFAELEIVVRASLSGDPVAQPGDWFGQARVQTSAASAVSITLDRRVGD